MPATSHSTPSTTPAQPPHAQLPADVDAPDRILANLTARQVAVLATGAASAYLGWQALHRLLPLGVLVALGMPVLAVTALLALGRRDGLPLEVWAWHAVRYRRAPRRLLPARVPPPPPWSPPAPARPRLGLLRLPADAVTPDGLLQPGPRRGPGNRSVMLVAASTLNLTARSPADQVTLVAGMAAWLNGLTGPTQIVISPRRVDLTRPAVRIADSVHLTGERALTEAGLDHAEFLLDLMTDRDPLARTVTIALTGTGGDADAAARRAAETTAAALAGLGADTAVLDAGAVTAVLATAVDPYQPGDPATPRQAAGYHVTGRRPGTRP